MSQETRIGLALGAGAARGLAHVGVLEVLESRGFKVDAVAGTSMGAIIGAVYLLEGSCPRLLERMHRFFESEAFKEAGFDYLRELREEEEMGFLNAMAFNLRRGFKYSLSVTRQAILAREVFERIIEELVPDIRIEDLPRPFCASSLDVTSGEEMLWFKGSLRDALWASSAIPGFFPPLVRDGRILVDGGWTNAVPVGPCRELGADKVIAVDISREIEEILDYKRGISLVLRAALLTSKHLRELQLKDADIILRPDVGYLHWADFTSVEEVIQRGKDAALVALDQLLELKTPPARGPRTIKNRLFSAIEERLKRTTTR